MTATDRPRLLDLFCGAGGAGMGYTRAGFEVVGVDIAPQPRYPFTFIQGDALEYVRRHGKEFDAIHASPPCQAHSRLQRVSGFTYLDLVPDTRSALADSGRSYVIENVVGAPLLSPIVLCGVSLGRPLYRHRLFESSASLNQPPHVTHCWRTTSGHGKSKVAARYSHLELFCDPVAPARSYRQAMECEWMTAMEAAQAIPPAYSQWVGEQLLEQISYPHPTKTCG